MAAADPSIIARGPEPFGCVVEGIDAARRASSICFNGNVTSGTAGTEVQLAMTIDGTPLAETTMIETIGTANSYQNLAARTYLKVCPGEDVTLSVTNTGAAPVTIDANAALTARRIA